ncbi:MAG TPA: hypothetical protein PLZ78_09055 [Spirochaetota bacterium]|nr:hypothetical protein [Spirochaetota bacterium]
MICEVCQEILRERIEAMIVKAGGVVPMVNDYNYAIRDVLGVIAKRKEEKREEDRSVRDSGCNYCARCVGVRDPGRVSTDIDG